MKANCKPIWLRATVALLGFALISVSTGCQVSVGGLTLPSAYYDKDDVQYFAPGTEFKLSREAAAMKAYEAEKRAREQ